MPGPTNHSPRVHEGLTAGFVCVGLILGVLLLGGVFTGSAVAETSIAAVTAPADDTLDSDPAETAGVNTSRSYARIVELYPNPTTEGNRGEYLVVWLPSTGNWSLSDGYHTTPLPANASGTLVLSMDPNSTKPLLTEAVAGAHRTQRDVHQIDGYFPLSAAGDRIELRTRGETVDTVAYDRVREGYRWRAEWNDWRPRGYTPRQPQHTENAVVRPFVLPDTPAEPVAPLRGAEQRLLLAGYTLESERVADILIDAAERGVTVRVLVEGTPVGGFSTRSARLLDRLDDAGVEIGVLDDDPNRFRFHHPKYAVADDRAVVLTENWKPSGTGGRSNRGWGISADSPDLADDLASVFHTDASAHDVRSWEAFRADTTMYERGVANGTYPARFDPPDSTRASVELLTAPGNAADRIVDRIDAADDRVLAINPRTGADDRIVRALRRAADRGVDVHLLLSGAWYDSETNRALAAALADEPIDVAVAEPRGRYGTVHAKGLIIDDTVIVGSLNWNEVAATENREVLLAVADPSIASFFARTYAADWRGGGVHLPVGLLGGLGAALTGAGVLARREVQFT